MQLLLHGSCCNFAVTDLHNHVLCNLVCMLLALYSCANDELGRGLTWALLWLKLQL